MNEGRLRGGVVKGAVSAYSPTGQRRVLFSVATRDSRHASSLWNCEVEADPTTLDRIEAAAIPGAGIDLRYELATRPFIKNGVHTGEIRFLRVLEADFPPRATRGRDGAQEGEGE
jgi:hypothetical protein